MRIIYSFLLTNEVTVEDLTLMSALKRAHDRAKFSHWVEGVVDNLVSNVFVREARLGITSVDVAKTYEKEGAALYFSKDLPTICINKGYTLKQCAASCHGLIFPDALHPARFAWSPVLSFLHGPVTALYLGLTTKLCDK